jgi:L,D-transpeptidase ErfK/SrfK
MVAFGRDGEQPEASFFDCRDMVAKRARSLLAIAFFCCCLHSTAWAKATRLIGSIGVHFVRDGDTLLDIARDNGFGILELMAANPGVDPWVPESGLLLLLPSHRVIPDAPERGMVINLSERRLYLFDDGGSENVRSWPIGIGRFGFTTPLGKTKIVRKAMDPVWRPTPEMRAESPDLPAAVPAGPDNPLGKYALYLGWQYYAVHGTNKPWGIGRQISRGCIRLYPEDIADVFQVVDVGMKVTVVDQPVKLGWKDGRLYLEIHPSRAQLSALESEGKFQTESYDGLMASVEAAAGEHKNKLNRSAVSRAERERLGVPVAVSTPVGSAQ